MGGIEVKGVLFDLDGTLTFPGAIDFPAVKKELGCPLDQPILEYIQTQPLSRRSRLSAILAKREKAAAEASCPNVGAEHCLGALMREGLPIGLLTRNSMASVEAVLERFRSVSSEDFAAVVTRETSPPKPHPGGVLEAARRMGLSPRELLMVGDFRFDVMAGKAAGAKTALLTNGGRSACDDPPPDYVIGRLTELLPLLGICGPTAARAPFLSPNGS